MASQQYAYRAQKSLGLVGGSPDYIPIAGFVAPDVPARDQTYSDDGRLYAYALPTAVCIFQAEGAQLLQELPLPNIVDLSFSPRGTYLSTWERPVKLDDGAQHKNLRIFSTSTGDELISFTQKSQEGWAVQYTISESHAIRLVGGEIQVFKPAEWGKGVVDKLRVEGASSVALSPGLNPSLAVFIAEKKGAPASIKIYSLAGLASPPTCSKTFFKADRAQIKWNTLGTQVLVLTQTEVDNSNKSYYGETGMYLLSAAGNFDCRVTLDKEGPIHDFAWSPNSKEFGVVYGYMPAKTMLFDQRFRTVHDFGASPHNFISFNPQGRLVALAGFGNLAGKIDIFDRRSLAKTTTIDAPNTSYCSWSPDGRFLLTATLSPRLRVDNGVKIWHCSGTLVHIQLTEELYSVIWRPAPIDSVPQFGAGIPPPPTPSQSVMQWQKESKPAPLKAAGAYRPPGARGLATPAIFKREDEGGLPGSGAATPNGAMTPPRYRGSPVPGAPGYGGGGGANGQNGYGNRDGGRQRQVPGAPSPSGGQGHAGGGGGGQQDGKQQQRKKRGKKEGGGGGNNENEEALDGAGESGQRTPNTNGRSQGVGGNPVRDRRRNPNGGGIVTLPPPPPPPIDVSVSVEPVGADVPLTPGADGALDPAAKKARNLNKKLKAIEELKEKAKRGERLETTQLRKIEGEEEIKRELASLGV